MELSPLGGRSTATPTSPTTSMHDAVLQHYPHPPPHLPASIHAFDSAVSRPSPHGAIGQGTSLQSLPSHVTIQHLTPTTLASFRRLISLLLPIRYPDKFFTLTLSDPVISSLSRIAIWQNTPSRGKRKLMSPLQEQPQSQQAEESSSQSLDSIVVGGIRCILEPISTSPQSHSESLSKPHYQLYIQTLGILSPYRSHGIATALLNTVVHNSLGEHNVVSIYAHVWEANTEALEWYQKRGFVVGELVAGYYRRLKPGGARIVRRAISVKDFLDGMTMDNGTVEG